MSDTRASQGSLFTPDFLTDSIRDIDDWNSLAERDLDRFRETLEGIFAPFPISQRPNETQTEDDLIWPILGALGWTAWLRQQNLSPRGRDDVPDGILFDNDETKNTANGYPEEWKRYEPGCAVVESKRWGRPLDRRSGRRGEETAPSSQMLRYLRRVDDVTEGKLRWGILTNGQKWRLYFSGARSVSEQFFEIDIAEILDLPDHNEGLFALGEEERRHWLKVFLLIFRRDAFVARDVDPRSFHEKAIEEGRFYERRVAEDLSNKVFGDIFQELARAIVEAAPQTDLQEVRDGALILLYRLLFILYAEDRDLLPVRELRYDDYGLRKMRVDVGDRIDRRDVFSDTAARYWGGLSDLFIAIDLGDASIGLPPYNGGLFDPARATVLTDIRIPDATMARVIDALSFERMVEGKKYINYRSLSVQQLGSIYERLLEYEVVCADGRVAVRPNIFARKGSGSYYTPDDLVQLILAETLEPLVEARKQAFRSRIDELGDSNVPEHDRLLQIRALDPATALLDLKVCDPAMGSGHFLVGLVDLMADQVIAAIAEAEIDVPEAWGDYVSPLIERIDTIRGTILANAEQRSWTLDPNQLDDRHIIRRMVLKRCVYGVDKNPMAVELTKVSLWLHTFTVGAPLSFLDHHLRCGDSLFGAWVRPAIDKAERQGALFLREPLNRATHAAGPMQTIEELTDAEIAETDRSAEEFAKVLEMTAPLNALLSLLHAFEWMNLHDREDRAAYLAWLDGTFGDPIHIAQGGALELAGTQMALRFSCLLEGARELIEDERFLNWQVAFPGVWSDWEEDELRGGFDAVVGNPPWDRMKLQQVEWFSVRRAEIAMAPRASDRKRMIAELENAGGPLADGYARASEQASSALRMARKGGEYPLLSRGDVNLYSLFVERAMTLVKPEGMVGLLVPSGIASDKTAAGFFKGVATEGRLKALYDFENRRTRYNAPPFFPDVDSRFKFCVFAASPLPLPGDTQCAFFLQSVSELADADRRFTLSAEDFARVNPNTGTAPIFRSRRDAELTKAIYDRLPVLVDRSSGETVMAWPVKYSTMFHMTNDSGQFRTRVELEEMEGAWHVGGNRYDSASGPWVPLYVGRMIRQFDHRAASVEVNEWNLHNPALSGDVSAEQKVDPSFSPTPQYWVRETEVEFPVDAGWAIAFRDIARATDVRTMIAAAVPRVGLGNTAPAVFLEAERDPTVDAALLLANFCTVPLDFVVRQKTQSTHLNWYIVEQLPVVPPERYQAVRFGTESAAEIVREAVLELTYTAHDMAPFAIDLGHVDREGEVLAPFRWDEERRLELRAKLDALYFHLYGITDRDDIRYVYSTFPIVKRHEMQAYGSYRSRELCLAWFNALGAGNPQAEIAV